MHWAFLFTSLLSVHVFMWPNCIPLTFLLLYAFAMCSSFFLFSLFKKVYSILKRLKDKILLRSLFPSVVSISLLVYDSGRVFVSTPKTFIIDFLRFCQLHLTSLVEKAEKVEWVIYWRLVFWSGLIKSVSSGMILNLKLPLMHPLELHTRVFKRRRIKMDITEYHLFLKK